MEWSGAGMIEDLTGSDGNETAEQYWTRLYAEAEFDAADIEVES